MARYGNANAFLASLITALPSSGGSLVVPSTYAGAETDLDFFIAYSDSNELTLVHPHAGVWEIVERGADGTTATAHAAGTQLSIVMTKGWFDRAFAPLDAVAATAVPAHYALMGPTSGSAALASYRAMVASDIPDLSATYATPASVTSAVAALAASVVLTLGSYATLAGSETLANKTLTTPTIGSFANATHTHQNAAGGGWLDASAIGSGTLALARLSGLTTTQFASAAVSQWTNDASYTTLAAVAAAYQPLDADLTAIAALSTDGLPRRTSGSWAMDATAYLSTAAAASGYQPLDADLTALAALSTDGVPTRASGSWSQVSYLPLAGGTLTGSLVSTIGTITASTPALTASQTWNSSGVTFKGAVLNVTNTASAAASVMFDVQLSGVSYFAALPTGEWFIKGGSAAGVYLSTNSSNFLNIRNSSSATGVAALAIDIASGSTHGVYADSGSLTLRAAATLGWSSTADARDTLDTVAVRDAAGVWAWRNGATAQTVRGYASYTDASNYTRWALSAATGSPGNVTLAAESAGTGSANVDIVLAPKGSGGVRIGAFYHQLTEMTAPAAGASDTVRIYAVDNGAGKTQLMALFATGAAQQIAIQP